MSKQLETNLPFPAKEDNYKLKLYDEGAALSLEKAVKILPLKEATKRESKICNHTDPKWTSERKLPDDKKSSGGKFSGPTPE